MSRNDNKRINTGGGSGLGQNPFGALEGAGLPVYPDQADAAAPDPDARGTAPQGGNRAPAKPSGRIEVRREKSGRGGKTVTLVRPLKPIPPEDLQALADELKRNLGTGGGVEEGKVVIQGAKVDAIVTYLQRAGWNAFGAN